MYKAAYRTAILWSIFSICWGFTSQQLSSFDSNKLVINSYRFGNFLRWHIHHPLLLTVLWSHRPNSLPNWLPSWGIWHEDFSGGQSVASAGRLERRMWVQNMVKPVVNTWRVPLSHPATKNTDYRTQDQDPTGLKYHFWILGARVHVQLTTLLQGQCQYHVPEHLKESNWGTTVTSGWDPSLSPKSEGKRDAGSNHWGLQRAELCVGLKTEANCNSDSKKTPLKRPLEITQTMTFLRGLQIRW